MTDIIKQLRMPGYDLGKEQAIQRAITEICRLTAEVESLRAKIEQMEKQYPICRIKDIRRAHYLTKVVGLDPEACLYALPGAKGETK